MCQSPELLIGCLAGMVRRDGGVREMAGRGDVEGFGLKMAVEGLGHQACRYSRAIIVMSSDCMVPDMKSETAVVTLSIMMAGEAESVAA